jgi:hypothetical protein
VLDVGREERGFVEAQRGWVHRAVRDDHTAMAAVWDHGRPRADGLDRRSTVQCHFDPSRPEARCRRSPGTTCPIGQPGSGQRQIRLPTPGPPADRPSACHGPSRLCQDAEAPGDLGERPSALADQAADLRAARSVRYQDDPATTYQCAGPVRRRLTVIHGRESATTRTGFLVSDQR